MFANQLQILLVEVLFFTRTRALLLASPASTLLNLFIFVDDKAFTDLSDASCVSDRIGISFVQARLTWRAASSSSSSSSSSSLESL